MRNTTLGDSAKVERPWHTLESARTIGILESSADLGLSNGDAAARRVREGSNEIIEASRRGPLRVLLAQFADVTVLLLIGAAVVAAVVGEPQDIAAIIAIVVLNGVLGFVQEYRAEQAVEALKAMAPSMARVRRGGTESTIPAAELARGDLVLLEAGNIVPADLRLIDVKRLRVDEAALTGESLAVEKHAAAIAAHDLPLGDRRNMAYKGTTVAYGRAVGVVVATGMQTELGRIAMLLRRETGTRTPLQKRLGRFGRNLAAAILALCAIIFFAGLLRGEPPMLIFMTALSLAVAAIPEALPAVVTVALALGARRMAREHALIRRLAAVETLGSVTFVCSDKTGTLTENQMRVEAIETDRRPTLLPLTRRPDDAQTLLMQAMALNSDVSRDANDSIVGDPTEVALFRAASDAAFDKDVLATGMPRLAELPFSSERSRMTTVHRAADNGAVVVFTKGSPERVLPLCSSRLTAAGPAPIAGASLFEDAERLAASGLRVLAIAMRRLPAVPRKLDDVESEQMFLGFVGLVDPPRAEATDAVAQCSTAGIRVVMITGDHRSTALAIARRLGIAGPDDLAITGPELAAMTAEELDARVRDIHVYARVAPEDKIRIVTALQRRGEYVAMTGDGVNDAPALRRADIGVSMGKGGTDVAREASHMVLLDDNFATIVKAVREGRRIYDNIRRFIRYSLSTNSGEIWTLFLAPFVGLPVPLLPIHILWMNLVTDGLPGIALAAEPAEHDVMSRPPRPPGESIFAHGLWQHAVWVGLLMASLALGTQAWAIHVGDAHWQSMTFTVLTLSQLAHVLAIRSERESFFRQGPLSNTPLAIAVALTVIAQVCALYLPPLSRVFRTTALTAGELGACVGLASIVFVAVEIEKSVRRAASRRRGPDAAEARALEPTERRR
jgi:P-type Ca2+ transporter type 2C